MAEFSNLLRQRLATRAQGRVRADAHPDSDLLTAYIEQVLPASERTEVMRHLALCRDCRDVVALSLPNVSADEAAAAPRVTAGRSWAFLWNPRFRMAASAAVVLIVAVVLLQVGNKPSENAKNGYVAPSTDNNAGINDSKVVSPSPEVARGQVPAQPSIESKPIDKGLVANAAVSPRAASSPAEKNRATAGVAGSRESEAINMNGAALMASNKPPARYDYVNPAFFANNVSPDQINATVTANELPAAPAPPASRTSGQQFVIGPSAANTMNYAMNYAGAPTQIEGTQIVRNLAPPSGSNRFVTSLSALAPKAKKIIVAGRTAPAIVGGQTFTNSAMIANPRTAAAEPVTGAEKADSDLDSSSAFRVRAMHDAGVAGKMESAGPQSFWRVAGGKLLKSSDAINWAEGYPQSEGIEFVALSSRGQDIWAGGSNAALLHSRDGGVTFERITLGSSATGTINRIDIRGTLVQVKSSSGQSWSSRDGGKTWTLDE